MDAMALLCNMHADGPATIKVLRRAGVSSLSDITRARHERLAELLGVSPAYARRFAREARLLGDRLGEVVFDAEEAIGSEAPESPSRSALDAQADTTSSPDLDRALLDRQPSLFRPPAFGAEGGDKPQDATRAGQSSGQRIWEPAGSALRPGARVLPAQGTPLRRDAIEGLDAAWCDRLVAQGVLTLETLVDAPALKLARRLGVPLTALMDLQVLAQHALAESARGEARARAAASDAGTGRTPEPEPDYVLYPPRPALGERAPAVHALEECSEDLGLQDEIGLGREEVGSPATSLLFSSEARTECAADAEDVGGPFA
jgi:hypothetical protein